MADLLVSRAEIAQRLNLSVKQITNLVKSGRLADGTEFPSRVDGRNRHFPADRCFEWYVRWKQEEALERAAPKKTDSFKEASLRQAIADADIAELKLAGLRGQVAPVEEHRRELRRIFSRVRARIVSIPGTYASQLLGMKDMAEAVTRLRPVVVALLREMQQSGGPVEEDDAGEDLVEQAQ